MGETEPGFGADTLSRWVRDHGGAVVGFLSACLRDRDQAEDLAQDVFCRAWEARDRYLEQGKERAYLLRIADRLAKDRRRRSRREIDLNSSLGRVLAPSSDDSAPDQRLARDERKAELAAALEELTEPQRRTLLLRFFGELSFAEIAETLDCQLNIVLSHCHRGLAALRRRLVEQ